MGRSSEGYIAAAEAIPTTEEQRSVVRAVLSARRTLSHSTARHLDELLDRLQVDGFPRRPSIAPLPRLLPSVTYQLTRWEPLAKAILNAWIELNPPYRDAAERFAQADGAPTSSEERMARFANQMSEAGAPTWSVALLAVHAASSIPEEDDEVEPSAETPALAAPRSETPCPAPSEPELPTLEPKQVDGASAASANEAERDNASLDRHAATPELHGRDVSAQGASSGGATSAEADVEDRTAEAIKTLRAEFTSGSAALERAAERLKAGFPPSQSDIDGMTRLRDAYDRLRNEVAAATGAVLEIGTDLPTMAGAYAAHASRRSEQVAAARALAARVARLHGRRTVPGLDSVISQAAVIASGGGPLPDAGWVEAAEALVRLSDPVADADEADADRLRISVEQVFGKGIAWAALRGHIEPASSGYSHHEITPSEQPNRPERPLGLGDGPYTSTHTAPEGSGRELREAGALGEPPTGSSLTVPGDREAGISAGASLPRDIAEQHPAPHLAPPPEVEATALPRLERRELPSVGPCEDEQKPVAGPSQSHQPRGDGPPPNEPPPPPQQEVRPAQQVARAALATAEPHRGAFMDEAVWALLDSAELPVAYELARVAELQGFEPNVPSSLIRGLLFSTHVKSSEDQPAAEILESIQNLPTFDGPAPDAAAIRVLALAMALRPALVSRATGAEGCLHGLHVTADVDGELAELREAILDYAKLGLDLAPSVLRGVREHAAHDAQVVALADECSDWIDAARRQTLLYAPATSVWHRLVEAGQPISSLLEPILAQDTQRLSATVTTADQLNDDREIERLIRQTDRAIRKRKAELKPIEDRAYRVLRDHVREALGFVSRWKALVDGVPRGDDFRYQQADRCSQRIAHALDALRSRRTDHTGRRRLDISERVLTRALDDLHDLVHGRRNAPTLTREQIVRGGLLRIPDLDLGDDWEPQGSPPETAARILSWLANGDTGFEAGVDALMRREDFLGVERLLDLWERVAPGADLRAMRGRHKIEAQAALDRLTEDIERCRGELEQAVAHDLFTESERLAHAAALEQARSATYATVRACAKAIASVRGDISTRMEQRAAEVRTRLSATDISRTNAAAHERILAALARYDVPTANEYIDHVLAGEPLPPNGSSPDVFRDVFFPTFVRDMQGGEPSLSDILRGIREGRTVGPFDLTGVPGAQVSEASSLVAAWTRAKQRQEVEPSLKALFEGIGFRNVSVGSRPGGSADVRRFEVRFAPIQNRDLCPIPSFGSIARGKYEGLAVWGRPSEEDVLNLLPSHSPTPTVILYFGRMTEQRRRDMARLSRSDGSRQYLLIDECLVAFLAMQRGARMPVLYRCALPFTTAEPYVTSAGVLPPEMFFGRDRERRQIADPHGTNLVYGGRQLGKTALLRDVERRLHDADRGFIVRWIDLKDAGIGLGRPTSDLWEVIASNLEKADVVQRRTTEYGTIRRRLMEWLAESEQRRILLLLDEADAFLAAERNPKSGVRPFPTVDQLKGLMEATDRRFKFVLAGLHDVQRTANDPNTPMAHLGAPICIGPLLGHGESAEARALIEKPLATMGYFFDSPDLPTRILSHTNYYPSLIQLYCWHLLDRLANPRLTPFDPKTAPPYAITSRHVEEAYQNKDLRKAIRDRFIWTLNLDPRYRLIALLIAKSSLDDREMLVAGARTDEIRVEALSWWAAGFADDDSLDAFRAILDEMIGLGLLRKTAPDAYALRSANVLNLLGGKNDIDDQVAATIAMEPPPTYEPAQFRRAAPGDPWRRSPLSQLHESRILAPENGVALLFGPRAAGREAVPEFVQAAAPAARVETVADGVSWADVHRALERVAEQKPELGLVVVDASSAWSETWVEQARTFVARRQSKATTLRVLFVGDPLAAWRWMQLPPDVQQRFEGRVDRIALGPWTDAAVRRWLDDAGFGPVGDQSGRENIRRATGNWGEFLHSVGQASRGHTHRWEDVLASFAAELSTDSLRNYFEIPDALMPPLRLIAEYGVAGTLDELAQLDASLDRSKLQSVMEWADFLRFANPRGDGWELDPLVRAAVLP
jgi:hypothetical protein